MKTFGQVIMEARKKAGLTQKEVAEHLRREDGRKVLPPYLNDLEHDRRYPPENSVIDQLAKILGVCDQIFKIAESSQLTGSNEYVREYTGGTHQASAEIARNLPE
jgi:ribosome-binding protein aMBF1 (putative translation factor)